MNHRHQNTRITSYNVCYTKLLRLEQTSSVDIRTRGTGAQSDISIRGGSFEQTAVMINGIPLTDPQTGHHAFNIPVSIYAIDRIEVYPGGASGLFGPKAFSGAVNLVRNNFV